MMQYKVGSKNKQICFFAPNPQQFVQIARIKACFCESVEVGTVLKADSLCVGPAPHEVLCLGFPWLRDLWRQHKCRLRNVACPPLSPCGVEPGSSIQPAGSRLDEGGTFGTFPLLAVWLSWLAVCGVCSCLCLCTNEETERCVREGRISKTAHGTHKLE